tara:strand:+ start:1367 stop:3292 length:1926 start_codon:yes stop_codon:yes gene_type:complete
MAKEFYGYVQRERPTAVNWADVSKKITDKLDQDEKQRQEEQSSVLSAAQEFETGLKELKPGEREVITPVTEQVFVSQVGYQLGDASEALKNQMLSKQISKKDYNAAMSSLKGEYNLFKTFNQNYNTSYQKYQEDVQTGDLGPVNTAAGALLEKFGQVDNLEPSYKNGRLVFQRYDGSTPKGDEMTMKDLNGLMMFKSDKFDTVTKVSNVTKAVQKASSKTSPDGKTIMLDPRNNPNFDKTVTDLSAAQFTDQGQISATNYLIQNNKGGYKRPSFDTYDPNDTETIFMTIEDGIISVVPQQIKQINSLAVKSFAEDVKGTLPFKSLYGTTSTTRTSGGKLTSIEKSSKKTLDLLSELVGSPNKKTAITAANALVSQNKNITDIDYVEDPNNPDEIVAIKVTTPTGVQTVDVANVSGATKSIRDQKEVIQDLYNYSDAVGQGGKSGIAFDDAWRISGLTSQGTNYKSTKARSFSPTPQNYSTNPGFEFKNKRGDISAIAVTSDFDYWSKDNQNVAELGFSGGNKFDANMKDYWSSLNDSSGVPDFAFKNISVASQGGNTTVTIRNKRMPISFVVPKLADAQSNADLTSSLREAMFLLKDQNPDLKGKEEYNDYYYEQVKSILETKNKNAFKEWARLNNNLDKQ